MGERIFKNAAIFSHKFSTNLVVVPNVFEEQSVAGVSTVQSKWFDGDKFGLAIKSKYEEVIDKNN